MESAEAMASDDDEDQLVSDLVAQAQVQPPAAAPLLCVSARAASSSTCGGRASIRAGAYAGLSGVLAVLAAEGAAAETKRAEVAIQAPESSGELQRSERPVRFGAWRGARRGHPTRDPATAPTRPGRERTAAR